MGALISNVASLVNSAAENRSPRKEFYIPRDAELMSTSAPPKRRIFTRLLNVMMASHQRYLNKEIALCLATTGASGGLTDNIECEIERRFLSNRSR
jgi:hypothetical protein